MANLYSVLPGMSVSQDDILEAELFSQQYLQSQFPDLDLREGTAARDLVIRPFSTLLAMLNKGLDYYFSVNSISGIDNTTPAEIVDSLMSNWFLNRKLGSSAIINARLFFARAKNVTISQSTFFSPDNTLKFYPGTTYIVPAGQLQYDSYSDEFYLDVDLVSELPGSDYNISAGSLLYFSNFDPFFLRGEINYLKQEATNPESNEDFINRGKTAVSTRNLINIPSIISKLQENFNYIDHITPVGFGEPEMNRDLVTVQTDAGSAQLHIGGCVDVYCKVPLTSEYLQLSTDSNGDVTLEGPYYEIIHAEVSLTDTVDTIPASATASSAYSGEGFSPRSITKLSYGAEYANGYRTVEAKSFQYLDSIQDFLTSPENRVLSADLLARGYNLYLLDVKIVSHTSLAPDQTTAETAISEYVDSLVPGQVFVMSDMINKMYTAGLQNFKVPVEVTYTRFGRDHSKSTGTIVDYFDSNDRTSIFVVKTVSATANV